MTLRKYGDLTGDEVKSIVLDDKWHAAIATKIDGEVNALTLTLVARVQQLGERYAETVGDLDANLEELEAKVAGHLAAMGVES
jgi:type I restriction enzyme M protein